MTSCDAICITEWIFLFLWFLSVPTYCMVIYTVWKYRKTKFKEEFWVLTMALFVADILLLFQMMWSIKMAAWGLLPSALLQAPKVVARLIHIPKLAFSSAQEMGVVFVSLNRYVATVNWNAYTALWSRKVTIICICVQWGVALLAGLCLVPVRFNLQPNPGKNSSGFTAVPDERDEKLAGILMGVMRGFGGLLRVLLFTLLYGHMLYYVYKKNRAVNPVRSGTYRSRQNKNHHHRAERNLAIIGACLALCDMAYTIHAFDMAIHMDQVDDKVWYWKFRGACLSDIHGWMNAWLMLAFASKVRKQFLKQYRCVKSN